MGHLLLLVIVAVLCNNMVMWSTWGSCWSGCCCGGILPNNPYYFINDTSDVTCTLTSTNVINASDLYFVFNQNEVNSSHLVIVNETTLSFRKVMEKSDDGTYECFIRGLSEFLSFVGGQELTVDYPLVPVTDIQCIWYHWMERLVCSWELPPYIMGNINVTLKWCNICSPHTRYNGASGDCPAMSDSMTTCEWTPADGTSLDTGTWSFQLVTYNKKTQTNVTSQSIQKDQLDNVKPNKVITFASEFKATSQCLRLLWTYDPHLSNRRGRYFRIHYHPSQHPQQVNKSLSEVNAVNLTICGLIAYTEYVFTIDVHADREKGYWSDNVTALMTTDQDVPDAAAETIAYAVTTTECTGPDLANVRLPTTIYWKSIPEAERYGIVTHYNVTYTDISLAALTNSVNVTNGEPGETTSAVLSLHCNKLYNVTVTAATKKGYSPHSSYLIIDTSRLVSPDVMVERKSSAFNVSWTVTGPVELQTWFMVVYCRRLGTQLNCSDELERTEMQDSCTRSVVLSLKSESTYLFGVSMMRDGVGTGVQLESCVYNGNAKPRAPEFTVDTTAEHNSLRMSWDPLPCNDETPYIANFTVTWCKAKKHILNQCTDTEQSAVIQSSQQTEYVIRDLDRDVVYGVRMRSTSHSESSQRSDMKFGTPINNDLQTAEIIVVVVAAVFGCILMLAGLVCVCRHCRVKVRKLKKPYQIDLPNVEKCKKKVGHERPAPRECTTGSSSENGSSTSSDSSHALLSEKDKLKIRGYTNQISHDSGRGGSVSTEPESPHRLQPVPEGSREGCRLSEVSRDGYSKPYITEPEVTSGDSPRTSVSSTDKPYIQAGDMYTTGVQNDTSSMENGCQEMTVNNTEADRGRIVTVGHVQVLWTNQPPVPNLPCSTPDMGAQDDSQNAGVTSILDNVGLLNHMSLIAVQPDRPDERTTWHTNAVYSQEPEAPSDQKYMKCDLVGLTVDQEEPHTQQTSSVDRPDMLPTEASSTSPYVTTSMAMGATQNTAPGKSSATPQVTSPYMAASVASLPNTSPYVTAAAAPGMSPTTAPSRTTAALSANRPDSITTVANQQTSPYISDTVTPGMSPSEPLPTSPYVAPAMATVGSPQNMSHNLPDSMAMVGSPPSMSPYVGEASAMSPTAATQTSPYVAGSMAAGSTNQTRSADTIGSIPSRSPVTGYVAHNAVAGTS